MDNLNKLFVTAGLVVIAPVFGMKEEGSLIIKETVKLIQNKTAGERHLATYFCSEQEKKGDFGLCTLPAEMFAKICDYARNECKKELKVISEHLLKQGVSKESAEVLQRLPRHALKKRIPRFLCCSILRGHTDKVKGVEWSPDGSQLASSSYDNTIRIWRVKDGSSRILNGHTNNVLGLSWNKDGKRLASCSDDRTVRVWNTQDGSSRELNEGGSNWSVDAAWSPNGNELAWSPDDIVRIFNTKDKTCRVLKGTTKTVESLAWSPDGKELATASRDAKVLVWDVKDGNPRELGAHGKYNSATGVEWSPDSKKIASCSGDGTVNVWDPKSSKLHVVLDGCRGAVKGISWKPNGKKIGASSKDCKVYIWNPETNEKPLVLGGHKDIVNNITWSPNGKKIASCSDDKTVRVWRKSTLGEFIQEHCDK